MTRLMSTTLGLALLAGCTLRYDVEMKPQGRSLHRSITVNEEVLDAELESLRAALGPERIEVGDAHETPPQRFGPADLDRMAAAGLPGSRATLTFSSDTGSGPWSDGFSGLGAWTTYDSPLGTATCFLECIGGDVDLAGDLLHLQTAIDAAVREARLHVQEVLDGHPLRTRLLSLLRNRIHPDARDAVTLAWVMIMGRQMLPSGSAGDDDADRGLLREHADKVLVEASTAFLWQRDWITADEAVELLEGTVHHEMVAARAMIRALNLPLDGSGLEQLRSAMQLMQNADYRELKERLAQTVLSELESNPRLAVALSSSLALLTNRQVQIRLQADRKPISTNGQWHSASQQVRWALTSAPMAAGLTRPPLCWWAFWASPDAVAQDSVLGHVGITEDRLLAFCIAWQQANAQARADVRASLDQFARTRSLADIEVDADVVLDECLNTLRAPFSRNHLDAPDASSPNDGGPIGAQVGPADLPSPWQGAQSHAGGCRPQVRSADRATIVL